MAVGGTGTSERDFCTHEFKYIDLLSHYRPEAVPHHTGRAGRKSHEPRRPSHALVDALLCCEPPMVRILQRGSGDAGRAGWGSRRQERVGKLQ